MGGWAPASTSPEYVHHRVPALIGWGKGGDVTSAGWQVTLCDPIWHVSSVAVRLCANCYTSSLYCYIFTFTMGVARGELGYS